MTREKKQVTINVYASIVIMKMNRMTVKNAMFLVKLVKILKKLLVIPVIQQRMHQIWMDLV